MPNNANEIVDEIQGMVDSFTDKIFPIQNEIYNKVQKTLLKLTLDSNGNIKRNISNINRINEIKGILQTIVRNPNYQKNVSSIKSSYKDITKIQKDYFKNNFNELKEPEILNSIMEQSFENTISSLTDSGLNVNVVNEATKIVSNGIISGSSIVEMNDLMQLFLKGNTEIDGKLVSYSKQIVNDTLHSVARNYNSIMVDELGLQWYQYVGALVKGKKNKTNNKRHGGSRPWCIALVDKQWIHESELSKICKGNIDGNKVSLQGLMPDTNKSNIVSRCGGYNCTHQLTPVPEEFVPKNIRKEFANKNNNNDSEE